MSQFPGSKEFADEVLKDTLRDIKYDIDLIIEKIEGQSPEEYSYAILEEFLTSIMKESIHARRLADCLKQEVKNGKDT